MAMSNEDFTKKVESCGEMEVYFIIDGYGSFMWRASHDMAHGRIPTEDHAAIDRDIVLMRAA